MARLLAATAPLTPLRTLVWCALLLGVLLCAVSLSLLFGAAPLDLGAALSGGPDANLDRAILIHERLPRALLACIVGAALSAVGAAFQALMRNPLADPFVLGVSGGAAVGASAAIAAGLGAATVGSLALPLVPLGAFAGAVGSLFLVYSLARGRGRAFAYRVLLIGVVFNFFASAVIMFLKAVVGAVRAQEMLLWLMGSLSLERLAAGELLSAGALTLVGLAYLVAVSAELNVVSLGDEGALHLGVDLDRVRRRVFVASSLMVGAAVSTSGLIGFVGLVVPHALRLVVGADHRLLVPASALAGAAFLVLCDLASRLMFPVLLTEAPVGVVTALVGAPAFVWLLRRADVRGEV